MTSDPDEALHWDGDDASSAPSLPDGWNAVGKGSERVGSHSGVAMPATTPAVVAADDAAAAEDVVATEDAAPLSGSRSESLSAAALLSLGVLAGVFLLYAVGWVIGGLRLQPLARFLVADAMFLPWMWLAVLAPALWVIAALVLTRGRATWVRILAMLGGVVLLVPWPFVMIGAIGS